MRPVRRGPSPQINPFDPYDEAKPHLLARLGGYCSYCERPVLAAIAVEHIQPKSLPAYAALEGEWTNFLLACSNCNSAKGHQDVVIAETLLPDRDNTYLAFEYTVDGRVIIAAGLPPNINAQASRLLALIALDRKIQVFLDANGKQVVVDRASKRMEVYAIAYIAEGHFSQDRNNVGLLATIIQLAVAAGQFSIWMKVFQNYPEVMNRLIAAHRGTDNSGCFVPNTFQPVTHPNQDGLPHGGRI